MNTVRAHSLLVWLDKVSEQTTIPPVTESLMWGITDFIKNWTRYIGFLAF